MKHSHYLPLAPHPIADLWSARPPWSERAIGAAAAAVFLAGIVGAGFVDSQSGPDGPTLAAPAAIAASSGQSSVGSSAQVPPPATTSSGAPRNGTRATTASSGELGRSIALAPQTGPREQPRPPVTPPAAHSPGTPPVAPTVPNLPSPPSLPIPADGVTVGPVTVVTTPDNGASVTIAPGVIAPVTVTFP